MNSIQITNPDEVKQLIDQVSLTVQDTNLHVVVFTNANSWYIDSLVANLLKSAKIHEPNIPIAVFCTDDEVYEKCRELGFQFFAHVNIPELGVDSFTTNSDSTTEAYTR